MRSPATATAPSEITRRSGSMVTTLPSTSSDTGSAGGDPSADGADSADDDPSAAGSVVGPVTA